MHRIVILGGYGNFGSRMAAALTHEANATVFIAGRQAAKAEELAARIGGNVESCTLNHQASDLTDRLRHIGATIVVHAAGPFQGQNYRVASACISAGCHYVDLADGRDFVAHIGSLNEAAMQHDLLIVSGASSLPALSSAVVDKYRSRFSKLQSIEYAISSGAQPPGIATMQAVMSYVGKPFERWERGAWRAVHGWQDIIAQRFPAPLGVRWLASCDVPDLALFPKRYPDVHSVVFRAGVGFGSTTLAVWLLSWCIRARLIGDLTRYCGILHRAAELVAPIGSKWSAMRVCMSGLDANQHVQQLTWTLVAGSDHGPHIPVFPAVALARKLIRGEICARGAMPCMGLLSVEEILAASQGLDISVAESP